MVRTSAVALAAVAAALALTAAPPMAHVAEAAAVQSGDCHTTKTRYKTAKTNKLTFVTTFAPIPATKIKFTVSGTKNSCVRVQFTTTAYSPSAEIFFVRVRLDGAKVARPGVVQLTGDDNEDNSGGAARTRAFNFVFPSVAPGPHAVEVEWLSHTGGNIYVAERTTIVHYR